MKTPIVNSIITIDSIIINIRIDLIIVITIIIVISLIEGVRNYLAEANSVRTPQWGQRVEDDEWRPAKWGQRIEDDEYNDNYYIGEEVEVDSDVVDVEDDADDVDEDDEDNDGEDDDGVVDDGWWGWGRWWRWWLDGGGVGDVDDDVTIMLRMLVTVIILTKVWTHNTHIRPYRKYLRHIVE